MVNIRRSLTETLVLYKFYWLQVLHCYCTVHIPKQYKVESPSCYCNSEMMSVQKIQQKQHSYENFHWQWQNGKRPKKLPNFTKRLSVFFHAHCTSELAMKRPIWQPCAYLSRKVQETKLGNFTWNWFPIKNLLIYYIFTPIVESTCLICANFNHRKKLQSTHSQLIPRTLSKNLVLLTASVYTIKKLFSSSQLPQR